MSFVQVIFSNQLKFDFDKRYRSLFSMAGAMAVGMSFTASAQLAPPPPELPQKDDNSVHILGGILMLNHPTVSIGDPEGSGLSHEVQIRTYAAGMFQPLVYDPGDIVSDNWEIYALPGYSNYNGQSFFTTISVSFASESSSFIVSGAAPNYIFTAHRTSVGSKLIYNASQDSYVFTSRTGVVITFPVRRNGNKLIISNATGIVYPTGRKISLAYKSGAYAFQSASIPVIRLQSVRSNEGWMLKYQYSTAIPDPNGWLHPSAVTALNLAEGYCDPEADACAATANQPTVQFGYEYSGYEFVGKKYLSGFTVTAPGGGTTRYTIQNNKSQISGIRNPASVTNNVTISYDAQGRVASVARDGATWNYAYTDVQNLGSFPVRTVTVTTPGGQRVYRSGTGCGLVYFKDELNRISQVECGGVDNMKVVKAIYPEGNFANFAYDARGNHISTTMTPKAGSGLPTRTYENGYEAACANIITCNKPSWARDPLGNQTDYTYDPVTGLVLTETRPAPTPGAPRPQTRTSYVARQAYFRNSVNTVVASGQPIMFPFAISSCTTLASCAGTADERRTEFNYGPQTPGVVNNLLLRGQTDLGNGLSRTTCNGFDSRGNRISSTAPKAGLTQCP